MRLRDLNPWDVSPTEAARIQDRLAQRVIPRGEPKGVRHVAACDIAFPGPGRRTTSARAAVVLLSYPDLDLVEQVVVQAPVTFPYVPGLLSFREIPALIPALRRLRRTPDLLLVDGQGLAHPRRFGLACHVGLLVDLPTIGVAKSRLIGGHTDPAPSAGSRSDLRDGADLIGLVLRTRDGVSPLYISVGHRIGLQQAAAWVLRLCRGLRLPEPARLADKLSKGQPLVTQRPLHPR